MSLPLLLLPGLLCDRALWQGVIPSLQSLPQIDGITVPDLTLDESMAAMAERVLQTAPPRFILGGLSMGGYLAFEMMRRAGGRVEGLMLVDTQPNPETPASQTKRLATIDLAKSGKFKGVTRHLLPSLVHPSRVDDQAVAPIVLAMAERVGVAAFIRQQTAILGRADSRPTLAEIACPTLVMVGEQDQITPLEVARDMAASIADSRLVVVPHCGHLPPIERPEFVAEQMVRFCAKLRG
ncbi:MAG: alpha/beta hydrolase [Candidatus Pacebacteria bacterium]|nr:alpha/beta hydrolase [Candidatus Paceibacterota bacterium]